MRYLICRFFHRKHWEIEVVRFRNGHISKASCPKCGIKLLPPNPRKV